jgi:hypothetical protein
VTNPRKELVNALVVEAIYGSEMTYNLTLKGRIERLRDREKSVAIKPGGTQEQDGDSRLAGGY